MNKYLLCNTSLLVSNTFNGNKSKKTQYVLGGVSRVAIILGGGCLDGSCPRLQLSGVAVVLDVNFPGGSYPGLQLSRWLLSYNHAVMSLQLSSDWFSAIFKSIIWEAGATAGQQPHSGSSRDLYLLTQNATARGLRHSNFNMLTFWLQLSLLCNVNNGCELRTWRRERALPKLVERHGGKSPWMCIGQAF